MAADLTFTGERFVPGTIGEIVYEHVHRYAFALRFARGARVLDAACGEGYGSALLADVASDVTGVDIDAASLRHARSAYGGRPNLRFAEGSVTRLPLADASVELVVSFETLEHVGVPEQERMLAEFSRVLTPRGLLIISSPNRPEYSDRRNHHNPFHLHELDRSELEQLLASRFPARRWYGQSIWLGSVMRCDGPVATAEAWEGGPAGVSPAEPAEAMYFLVVAARTDADLPSPEPSLSLFADREQSELARHEGHAKETMRIDTLAAERLAALDRQMFHIQHLERLLAERDAEVTRLGSRLNHDLAQLQRARDEAAQAIRECDRLQRAVEAQERIINYRQSVRWWVSLPWLRVKLAWKQWLGR